MKHISTLVHSKIKSAIVRQDLDAVANLIRSQSGSIRLVGIDGNSLLQTSLNFFHENIFKLLLMQGADVNYRNEDGYTALTIALLDGNVCAIILLLRAGASLDETQSKDSVAKAYAVQKNLYIETLLTQAAQGELSPLHPLEDNPGPDAQMQPDAPPTVNVIATEKQESLNKSAVCFDYSPDAKSMFSWLTISGTLKHRLKNTTPFSSIEMSSNPRIPSQPPLNNHPHAD